MYESIPFSFKRVDYLFVGVCIIKYIEDRKKFFAQPDVLLLKVRNAAT